MREIKALEPDINEEWRKIPDAPEQYEVSNLGRVRSLQGRVFDNGRVHKGRVLSQGVKDNKYLFISLGRGFQNKYVHRLVAAAFIPNPDNLPMVNHKDGNKQNNNVNNLEWSNKSLNALHYYRVLGTSKIAPVIDLETGVYYNSALECYEFNSDKIIYPYKTFKEILGGRMGNKTSFVRCVI